MKNSTMATSPTTEPRVAAAITPALEAETHNNAVTDGGSSEGAAVCEGGGHIQVMTSRLMEQLSEPAVLLALQMYFPDMLLVRLLSLRVPCRSSAEKHTVTHTSQTCIFKVRLKKQSLNNTRLHAVV